jgi:hypothetical protein
MKQLVVYRGVKIFDAAQIVGEVSLSAEGFLTAPVNFTKAGIFIYHDETGKPIRVLRPESEVFKAESMATLERKPATFNHPTHLPSADDIKKYVVGATGDQVSKVADFLRGTITVFDKAAIDAINAGNHEVSCGYSADVVKESGVHHEFGPYDMIQKNIVYNHVAVGIAKGRGGPDVRMLLDSADPQTEITMATKKIKVGDKEYEVPEDLHDALSREKAAMDSKLEALAHKDAKGRRRAKDAKKGKGEGGDDDDDADDENEEAMDMADLANAVTMDSEAGATAQMDAVSPRTLPGRLIKSAFSKMQGRLVAAQAQAKTQMDSAAAPEKLAAAAREHAKLVATACAVMDDAKPHELFAKPAAEIKKAVILAKLPNTKFEGKDAAFVDGMFEGIASSVTPSNVGEVLGKVLMDSAAEPQHKEPFKDSARAQARKPWTAQPLLHSTRPQPTAKA